MLMVVRLITLVDQDLGVLWVVRSLVLLKVVVILLILMRSFVLFIMGYKSLEILILRISFVSKTLKQLLTFIKDGALPTHPYAYLIDKICSYMLRD